jgi:predicted lipid carrier protein YhbT
VEVLLDKASVYDGETSEVKILISSLQSIVEQLVFPQLGEVQEKRRVFLSLRDLSLSGIAS